ncbi:glycosyltransferase [Flavobacteriaceae bacterium]|jgi:glycosyltransferase involved in cell wall biosynthesis|nr:glycosyltransferase [Flavobacteriaceae bacterium]
MSKISYGFLIPIYKNDKPNIVYQALESVFNQTHLPNEVIVVIEGEISKSLLEVINSFKNKKINYRKLKIEKQIGPLGFGLPASLNLGIINSQSDYIVRLDSDDISINTRLEIINSYLQNNRKIELLGSNIIEYDENLETKLKERVVPEQANDIFKKGKFLNPFNGPSVVFKRTTALKLGGYPLVGSNEDYCLWASFMKYKLPCYNIQQNLVKMRAGDEIIKRRNSIRYIKGEIQSMKYLYGIEYFNIFNFIFQLTGRILIRVLLPTKILKKVYFKYLRT